MAGSVRSLLVSLAALCLTGAPAAAAVRIVHGPTPIPGGDASAAGDLTVVNERLAFSLAIQSPVPYGVPKGALVDLAPVTDGKIARDRVVFADVIPNNWSAWPNTYQRVTVVKQTPDEVVIRAERDWGEVTVSTVYSLQSGADQVHMAVTLRNGGASALNNLRSGVTLWPGAGFLFAVPGLAGLADGPAARALSDRVTAYDEDWAITLHAPYLDHVGYGSKDMYLSHSLGAGESRGFEAWLQVGARGDLAPVVAEEIARKRLPSGELSGAVRDADGKPVERPVVVIEKAGKPFAWTLGQAGRYRIALPAGDYGVYATAKGYSQTTVQAVHVGAGAGLEQDFAGLQPPGAIAFSVSRKDTGAPLDARISIEQGQKPLVEFLGRRTFFTELDRKGQGSASLAPGDYDFKVAYAPDVLAAPVTLKARVEPGKTLPLAAAIEVLFDPKATGWVSADLHHHSDQAEAVTPLADLARSELAAGLDLLFVSDHDTTINHRALQAIADRRGVGFIPSVEISTSWAHFNAFPLNLGERMAIDTGQTTIDGVLAEARRLGAAVVQVNHPFIPYGYFASLAGGVAPGGWNPGFDLVEINGGNPPDDDKVLGAMARFWTRGDRYYLSGGTDTHDVWNQLSGQTRTFAHVDGPATPQAYAAALKAGRSYVTHGPLIAPLQMFGDDLKLKPGAAFSLDYDLMAVGGLKRATLVGQAGPVRTLDLTGQKAHATFPLSATASTWYAIVVEDKAGRRAYGNPVWVKVTHAPE